MSKDLKVLSLERSAPTKRLGSVTDPEVVVSEEKEPGVRVLVMESKRGKEYSVPSFHSPLPEKDLCLRLWVKQPRNEDIWARMRLGWLASGA